MEDNKYSISERIILKELYQSNKFMNIYYFHEQYMLSPAQLNNFIRKYENINVVICNDYSIKLTQYGKNWILKNRNIIFGKTQKYWSIIPEGMIIKKINLYQPYIPNIRKIIK